MKSMVMVWLALLVVGVSHVSPVEATWGAPEVAASADVEVATTAPLQGTARATVACQMHSQTVPSGINLMCLGQCPADSPPSLYFCQLTLVIIGTSEWESCSCYDPVLDEYTIPAELGCIGVRRSTGSGYVLDCVDEDCDKECGVELGSEEWSPLCECR